MDTRPIRTLTAGSNKPWRETYVEMLYDEGCDIHAAATGFEALALISKNPYDLILIDDSFTDLGLLEFCMNLRDLASPLPVVILAGEDLAKYVPFLRRFGLYYVGRRSAVLRNLPGAVSQVRQRNAAARYVN